LCITRLSGKLKGVTKEATPSGKRRESIEYRPASEVNSRQLPSGVAEDASLIASVRVARQRTTSISEPEIGFPASNAMSSANSFEFF